MDVHKQSLVRLLFDIRIWILVLFLVRLVHIDLPPLDAHGYRQCLTLGVSRNYLEIDPNLFAPRTILCDSRPGYEVMEFPVLNYAIFLLWKIFGEQNWCFRLLNVVVASLGLWHFHRIARRYVGDQGALAGTVLFGTSICFIYARKAMPDVFSLSLVLIGINLGWDYLERGGWWRLPLVAIITGAGLLSKIPAASAMALVAMPFFDRSIIPSRKIALAGALGVAMAAMSVWYFIWIPWAEKAYHHWWFFRLGVGHAWNEVTKEAWSYTKERFYPIALQSRVAFFFCVFGLIWAMVKKQRGLISSWLLYSAVFGIFILQVGKIFSGHEYYVIPYTPMMALLAGYGLSIAVPHKSWFLACLGLIAAEAIFWQRKDFSIAPQDEKFLTLKTITDQHVPANAKVLTSDASPVMMYFAHRRGWSENKKERLMDQNWLDGEATVGLHSAIIDRSQLPDSLQYPVVYQDKDFSIYKIKKD